MTDETNEGKCSGFVCGFSSIAKKLDNFIDRQLKRDEESDVARKQIAEMHGVIATIHSDTKNLQYLPSIAATNKSLATDFGAFVAEVKTIRGDSLAAALGKKQVPMPIFLLVVLTLCLILVLRELGNRDFHATPGGINITNAAAPAPAQVKPSDPPPSEPNR